MNFAELEWWRGETIAVMASGASMNAQCARAVREAGLHSIVVNRTFELAPWADMLYAADTRWWRKAPGALDFAGAKLTCSVDAPDAVLRVRNTGVRGFDPLAGNIRTGNNSGYQALHLAVQSGAKRIVLLGFDLVGAHWHAQHASPLKNPTLGAMREWCRYFDELAVLIANRCEVINCSAVSALTCFRKQPLQEALA